jgi:hypothetical protein
MKCGRAEFLLRFGMMARALAIRKIILAEIADSLRMTEFSQYGERNLKARGLCG